MPLYEFKRNDIFVNTLKTYPQIEFFVYGGKAYLNKQTPISGAFTSSVPNVPVGFVNLYEYNVDRYGGQTYKGAPENAPAGDTTVYRAPLGEFGDPTGSTGFSIFALDYDTAPAEKSGRGNPLIHPFVVKSGNRIAFRTTTTGSFNTETLAGEIVWADYPLSASISKEWWASAAVRHSGAITDQTGAPLQGGGAYVSHLEALRSVTDHYLGLSPHYAFSSASFPGSSSAANVHREVNNHPRVHWTKDIGGGDIGIVHIPSIFYGSQIKKGTVNLKYYVTGTLVGELEDRNRNGELVQVGPFNSVGSGSVAGVVLYNEGFLILTGSWDLTPSQAVDDYIGSGSPQKANWTYFAQSTQIFTGSTAGGINNIASPVTAMSSSFLMKMSGTTNTQVVTMLAHAPKGELNHSNNPTYRDHASFTGSIYPNSGSTYYIENQEIKIKNIASSSYNDVTASFKKVTYISKIGVYDRDRNLIAVAKVATPIKKTEERDYTFKLKLDI